MKYILVMTMVWAALVLPKAIYAEDFTLTKIGALEVNGKYYNHWWYEPTRLTLEGRGSKGANVDITIDQTTTTIKSSVEDGSWKYTHEKELEKTDHQITVGSGEKQISFVLTIGAGSVPQEEQTKGGLLEAGSIIPALFLFGISTVLIYLGFHPSKIEEIA